MSKTLQNRVKLGKQHHANIAIQIQITFIKTALHSNEKSFRFTNSFVETDLGFHQCDAIRYKHFHFFQVYSIKVNTIISDFLRLNNINIFNLVIVEFGIAREYRKERNIAT